MKEYIEKSEAIEALTGWDTDPTDEEIEFSIRKIPAADVVERKRGEWDARVMKDIGTYTVYWCSECNCFSYFKHNFCPNCGADMREGEHDSTTT